MESSTELEFTTLPKERSKRENGKKEKEFDGFNRMQMNSEFNFEY